MQSTGQRTDRLAADLILAYLEETGLSPEMFSRAAFNAKHGFVSGKQLRRIVETGTVPGLRIRGVIAKQMQRSTREIWRNAPVVAGRKARSRAAA